MVQPVESLVSQWPSRLGGCSSQLTGHQSLNKTQSTLCNRIYYEVFPKSEGKAPRWQVFKNLAKKVGLAPPPKNTVRELTPGQSSALVRAGSGAPGMMVGRIYGLIVAKRITPLGSSDRSKTV
jgi:hypothetical protein